MAFEGFEEASLETSGGAFFARIGGPEDAPPLVLLHGFPQTHLMWARIAPALARTRRVIAFDLPGYGRSAPPSGVEDASKRLTAERILEAMAALGHERFDIAGHDRGGRVAYRMALDHPDTVVRLCVLDILPTLIYWERMSHDFAMKIYHWPFLAQPFPLPERLVGAEPDFYIDAKLSQWTRTGDLTPFEPEALEAYRENARDPAKLKAMCDDYRAGATLDADHDRADRDAGRRIKPPLLAIWGAAGIAQSAETPLDVWERWGEDVRGVGVNSGHFPPEETPEETLAAMEDFFSPE